MPDLQLVNITPKTAPQGVAVALDEFSDCVALLEWATNQPGISCTVVSAANGDKFVQVEGEAIDTVKGFVGQHWITFDGAKFEALTNDEFQAKYTVS